MNRSRLAVTFAVDAAVPIACARAERAANALAEVAAVRVVRHDRAIGRDLRECDRFVTMGPRTAAALPHLRELATQMRAKTMALLFGDEVGAACTKKGLASLRRFCGRVAVDDAGSVAELRANLLGPVHVLAPEDPVALWRLLTLAPGAVDDVATHLVEATQWIARGNSEAAFASAARALQLAPDQPGIVSDVARLLANLGDRERAVVLCRRFLAQRPDAVAVDQTLRELLPVG